MTRRRLLLAGDNPNLICDLQDYAPETTDFSPGIFIDLSRPWAAEFDISSVSDSQTLAAASYAFFALSHNSTAWQYYVKVFSGYIRIKSGSTVDITTSYLARTARRLVMTLRHGAMDADRSSHIMEAKATLYENRYGTTAYGPFTATPGAITFSSSLPSSASVMLSAKFFYNRLKLYYTD